MPDPRVTRYKRVRVFGPGRDRKYGYTKQGSNVMRLLTDAMAEGHTVSSREYREDGVVYMDAEIIWDPELGTVTRVLRP